MFINASTFIYIWILGTDGRYITSSEMYNYPKEVLLFWKLCTSLLVTNVLSILFIILKSVLIIVLLLLLFIFIFLGGLLS